ncbi:protein CrdC [Corallococcus carmarthensis]|uniref:Protein CrdC n=1 Tax=Corallococcus carmarthensis TaxID=2316728 RepID=A0A3A8KQV6_9BACT|nr:protein CrdC [Corallococcus carmarthensis]NOK22286.1 protein CrdC [Corallococcus carmarthensis]RKH04772.1 protein CrdC [Corallococcus carmarthensis]
MLPAGRVEGTLLCHVGPHRIAFEAGEVASIAAPDAGAVSAHRAFQDSGGFQRVLVTAAGETVGVDGLEIDSEVLSVLPPSPVVAGASGGSLRGFVITRGVLWPLLRLDGFQRYLRGLDGEGA